MIHKVEVNNNFLNAQNNSNIDSNQYWKHNSDTGSVKYEGDTLFVHNGIDYIPVFESSYIDLNQHWKLVLEWARDKMYEEMENKKILEKYPEAQQSLDNHLQVLKNLKAMSALTNGDKNFE